MHFKLFTLVFASVLALSVAASPQLSNECKSLYGDYPIYTGPCEKSSESIRVARRCSVREINFPNVTL